MKTFEFSLKFALPQSLSNLDECIEKLGETGCNDALVGIGHTGHIAFNFDRNAASAFQAISSAVVDVKNAIPLARLIEATPDIVGLSDIAIILGCSRQYMRKLMLGTEVNFPEPLHEGKTSLWRLSKVLVWLKEHKQYQIDQCLLDTAAVNMQLNLAKESRDIDASLQKHLHALVS